MADRRLAAVILAAGKGTRMRSDLPKVLHPVAGRPMVTYPLALARALHCDPAVVVVGSGREEVEAALAGQQATFVHQAEQLGTGHALACTREELEGFEGDLLLFCGDVPLLREQTVEALLALHRRQGNAVTLLTAELTDPRGYGRIVRDGERVLRIVEERDASDREKALREINTGIYLFRAPEIFELLAGIGRDNDQGEYYLTDAVAAARGRGLGVGALAVDDPEETLGVNDRVQLARCTTLLRRRINEALMRSGVTLVDPETAYVEPGVEIGADTVIHPGVHLRGRTRIGRHCTVEPGCVVTDSVLGDHVRLKTGSVVQESEVGDRTDIGPMAHLRPGTVLAGENKIGNFVETKKATLGAGTKASHLTYLGDAEIGAGVNIGCGTITCNYDGERKHRTVIEDGVFVGSDVQLVAPVRVGRGSLIGAGSTITRDVPPDALAVSRSDQKNVEGWAARKRARKNKD